MEITELIKFLKFVLFHPTLAAILMGLAIGRELILWLIERQKRAKWWSSLDSQWKTIFKKPIRIKSEPTAKQLIAILSLTRLDCHEKKLTHLAPLRALTSLQTLNCSENQLTSLEPLRACTGLQTLDCHNNQLTSLGPLHGLKSLKQLDCKRNPSLSEQKIEYFKKAVPACKVSS